MLDFNDLPDRKTITIVYFTILFRLFQQKKTKKIAVYLIKSSDEKNLKKNLKKYRFFS